jgi:tetratricopeptide (TPR) repeat protein
MTKKRNHSRSSLGAMLLILGLSSLSPSAYADPAFLKQGIAEFNAGNYSDASGHFGAALSTDFNNSVLHYYLGNCYVHMKQREAAIREFRIAYALDPEKDVGRYAKQALAGLNADAPGAPGAATPAAPSPTSDAAAKAAVDKLLDLKSKPGGWMPTGPQGLPLPTGLPPIGLTPGIDPTKPLIPLSPGQKVEVGRGGRLIEPTPTAPTPPTTTSTANDTAKQLEALRKLYEGNRYVPTNKATQEIQKTADNLRELMTQQSKPGSHHLVPAGTNLYIRNYQTTPQGAPPPQSTPANTQKK